MLRFLITLSFLWCMAHAPAQEQLLTDSTVTFVRNWKKGEKALFLMTRVKAKIEDGVRKVTDSLRSFVEISVLQTTGEQHIMQWKYIPEKTMPVSKDPAINFLQHASIKYSILQTGEFIELVNWKELKDAMNSVINGFLKEKNSQDARLSAEIKKIFSSKENLETVLTKETQLYHTLYGGEFTLHQQIKTPTLLPNILGGDPFPSILTAELTGIDSINQTCSVLVTQEFDPEKVSEVLANWAKKFAKTPDFKVPAMAITDRIDIIADLKTGWMKQVTNLRTVVVEDVTATEIVTIKQAHTVTAGVK